MSRFGQVHALEELYGNNIHRLENIITLSHNKHALFDQLHLWFEATVSYLFY
jgi:hypothetical protein